jgi:hypothetical protein
MRVIKAEQYSAEWWEARFGVPSASNAGRIFTAKTMKPSAQAYDYACELIAETLCPPIPQYIVKDYESLAMRKGTECEPEARRWFAFEKGFEVKEVGFCISDCGRRGCSPDGLCSDGGGLELKCPLPKTHVAYLLDGKLPDAYVGQVHMSMIVTGYDHWWFQSYCSGFPAFLLRVERDDYTAKLEAALDEFWDTYQLMLADVRERLAPLAAVEVDAESFDTFF